MQLQQVQVEEAPCHLDVFLDFRGDAWVNKPLTAVKEGKKTSVLFK